LMYRVESRAVGEYVKATNRNFKYATYTSAVANLPIPGVTHLNAGGKEGTVLVKHLLISRVAMTPAEGIYGSS
jgi:hypothetical protein